MASASAPHRLMERMCNLRYLPTSIIRQRRPGDDKSPSQTALNFPRAMPRNPWRKGGSDVTSIYEAVDGSHFSGLVNYTIFEAPENYLVHVSGPLSACGRILLSMLDTPVFTDQENINSTFRDSSCSVDDPG